MPFNVNIVVLLGAVAVFTAGALLGFAWRNRQLKKSQKRVLELETEMIANHAEILRLHQLLFQQEEEEIDNVPVINLHKPNTPVFRKHS